MSEVKFGIIGLGNMAHKIARAMDAVDGGEVVAAGSRTREKARHFGEQYGLAEEKCYGDYEELASDDDIDVVYIATPVGVHKEHSLMCAEYGKGVLCEKSTAENAADLKEMVEKSRTEDTFFMEAMWTRFLPVYRNVRFWLNNNRLGDLRTVEADISISHRLDPEDIRFDPELGGGALLDLGIYPVSLFSYIFAEQPEDVGSVVKMGDTGVDEQLAASFSYSEGAVSSMYCSLFSKSSGKAVIAGTRGRIEIQRFWYSKKAELIIDGQLVEIVNRPHKINGYEYELQEVVDCIQEGKKESDIMPCDESIAIMKTMDRIREEW